MKKTISIEGMTCGHCVGRVKAALSGIPGVARVEVDLGKKMAVVEGTVVDDAVLKGAVTEAGYEVVGVS